MSDSTESLTAMVKRFQCPGCVHGPSPQSCPRFKLSAARPGGRCTSHTLGTFKFGAGYFALGLSKGFCRPGWDDDEPRTVLDIELYPAGSRPPMDKLNVPVWYMLWEGVLLIRMYSPRVNYGRTVVCEDAARAEEAKELGAIDVAGFLDEID